MEILIGVVFVFLFLTIVLFIATRKKGGKKKQKGRSQIIREANRKLAQDSHNPDGLIPLGELYYAERAWDKAFPLYETMVNIAPAHREIDPGKSALRYGICALKLDKLPEALKGLTAANNMIKNDFDSNYYLGLVLYKLKEYENASRSLKKAQIINPEAPNLRTPLGLSLFYAKHYKEALPHLKQSLNDNPENKEVLFAMAMAMSENGFGDKAMKIFMHLRADPKFGAKASLEAGMIHAKANQHDKAIQDFEIGLKHEGTPPELTVELNYRLATSCFASKLIQKGLQALNVITPINPNFKDVPQLIARYSELSQNTNLQIYLMSTSSDFVALCRKMVVVFYKNAISKIQDIEVTQEYVEIVLHLDFARSEEMHIFRFYRTQGTVSDLHVRDLHSKVSDKKADKGVCFTAGMFSEEAKRFAEGRPIDLMDKTALNKLLKKVDMS
ncbi:MAG: tetratricopeptide repeat protein [Treponema sp.]|nr:tetratricopeptide repeat protein [Treponema sp.]